MSTSELLEIRGLARQFAEAELRPHGERWDAERTLDAGVAAGIAELGFFGMLIPEQAGGLGFDLATYLAALEELARGEAGVALMVAQSVTAADIIARFAADAHHELLGELAAGTRLGCLALAGTDPHDEDGAVTQARESGGRWHVTGTKPWVTNGAAADVAVVSAQTSGGTALFVVESDAWSASEPAATMGLRAVPLVALTFADAPATHLAAAGDDVRGDVDRVGVLSAAAIAVGISEAALGHAVRYADEREQFGQAIRHFEGLQYKLAGMATRIAAARALVGRAAAAPDDAAAAAMAKVAAGECAMHVTTEAVQIFGGYGYMRDYPVEKLMRDAKAMEIVHGTSEMQRLRIAAALYAD